MARARGVEPGRTPVFTAGGLYAGSRGAAKLVATGQTLLVVADAQPAQARAAGRAGLGKAPGRC